MLAALNVVLLCILVAVASLTFGNARPRFKPLEGTSLDALGVVPLSLENFEAATGAGQGAWLVAFTSQGCPRCAAIAPELARANEILAELGEKGLPGVGEVRVGRVDATRELALVLRFWAIRWPALFLIRQDGSVSQYKPIGPPDADDLIAFAAGEEPAERLPWRPGAAPWRLAFSLAGAAMGATERAMGLKALHPDAGFWAQVAGVQMTLFVLTWLVTDSCVIGCRLCCCRRSEALKAARAAEAEAESRTLRASDKAHAGSTPKAKKKKKKEKKNGPTATRGSPAVRNRAPKDGR
jgi:hypothetical protein